MSEGASGVALHCKGLGMTFTAGHLLLRVTVHPTHGFFFISPMALANLDCFLGLLALVVAAEAGAVVLLELSLARLLFHRCCSRARTVDCLRRRS